MKPLHYLGRDLVAWRDAEGEPHVMDAYCPHLGAHLGYGGRVEGCELVCPFHWWRFDADGCNTQVPYDGSSNPAARIHTYPTAERNDDNPDMNPRLRLAMDKARTANMPSDNIKPAVSKGSDDQSGANYEETIY